MNQIPIGNTDGPRVGKLDVNMNFRQFLGLIGAKNLRESGISNLLFRGALEWTLVCQLIQLIFTNQNITIEINTSNKQINHSHMTMNKCITLT